MVRSPSGDGVDSRPRATRTAVAVGVGWGAFCGVVGNVIGGVPIASTLVQMAVPWVWVAAFVAYRTARSAQHAAVLGGVTLLAANLTYFALGVVASAFAGVPHLSGTRLLALWAVVGLVVGPVAGVLGWWLLGERTAFPSVVILATVTLAEPLALWAHIVRLDAHLAYVGVAGAGLAFSVLWFRGAWRRAVAAAALVLALTYPCAVVFEAVLIWLQQVSPPMRLI